MGFVRPALPPSSRRPSHEKLFLPFVVWTRFCSVGWSCHHSISPIFAIPSANPHDFRSSPPKYVLSALNNNNNISADCTSRPTWSLNVVYCNVGTFDLLQVGRTIKARRIIAYNILFVITPVFVAASPVHDTTINATLPHNAYTRYLPQLHTIPNADHWGKDWAKWAPPRLYSQIYSVQRQPKS